MFYNMATIPTNAATTMRATTPKNPAPDGAMAEVAPEVLEADGAPEWEVVVVALVDVDEPDEPEDVAVAAAAYKTELVRVVQDDVAGMTAGELPGGNWLSPSQEVNSLGA